MKKPNTRWTTTPEGEAKYKAARARAAADATGFDRSGGVRGIRYSPSFIPSSTTR